MSDFEVLVQQLINGFSNGMIITLIAIGYTLVYGIVELINFAHGDLVMLGAFFSLTLVGLFGLNDPTLSMPLFILLFALMLVLVAAFCGGLNWLIDRLAYRPLRGAPRLSLLVTAIGVSFIFLNIGLFWGALPMDVFHMGNAASAAKDFPAIISNANVLGESTVQLSAKDLLVVAITLPLLVLITVLVKFTRWGVAMRAVAQNPVAAQLMGINVDQVIGYTFVLGGALGGIGAVVYALYNNTIKFQMGYTIGLDGFTAAVLGGIGNLPGAMLGGLLIGMLRALSDGYISARWTSIIVFAVLIMVLIFRPSGLLGARVREKV